MRRVGIYGGSFNPIHLAHVQLGDELITQGLLDELWYVVSPQNPFKADHQLMPDTDRLRMAQLATQGHKGLSVCDVEMHMPRPSFMADTLALLRQEHPDTELVLVIGADNWERFPHWRRSEEILSHHRLIIYPRPGYSLPDLPEGIILADTSLLPISSTQIRQAMKQPTYRGEGLHPKVWEYLTHLQNYEF